MIIVARVIRPVSSFYIDLFYFIVFILFSFFNFFFIFLCH